MAITPISNINYKNNHQKSKSNVTFGISNYEIPAQKFVQNLFSNLKFTERMGCVGDVLDIRKSLNFATEKLRMNEDLTTDLLDEITGKVLQKTGIIDNKKTIIKYNPATEKPVDWIVLNSNNNFMESSTKYNLQTGKLEKATFFHSNGKVKQQQYYNEQGKLKFVSIYKENGDLNQMQYINPETSFFEKILFYDETNKLSSCVNYDSSNNKIINKVFYNKDGTVEINTYDEETQKIKDYIKYNQKEIIVQKNKIDTTTGKIYEVERFHDKNGKLTNKLFFNASSGNLEKSFTYHNYEKTDFTVFDYDEKTQKMKKMSEFKNNTLIDETFINPETDESVEKYIYTNNGQIYSYDYKTGKTTLAMDYRSTLNKIKDFLKNFLPKTKKAES